MKDGSVESYRVKLTEFTENDLIIYHKWFLESEPQRITCRPLGDFSLEAVIKRYAERFSSEKIRHFAARRIDDNEFLGRVTYFDLNTRNRSAEIGFLIGPKFQKQGYASEALALLLEYLFNKLNLNKVMAQTAEFNEASIALLKKIGFQQDGRLRQHHPLDGRFYDDLLFSILAEEYRTAN